jgi:hypothetical protein
LGADSMQNMAVQVLDLYATCSDYGEVMNSDEVDAVEVSEPLER